MANSFQELKAHNIASYAFLFLVGLLVLFFGSMRVWSFWIASYRIRTLTPSNRPLGNFTTFFRRINYWQPIAVLPSVDRLIIIGLLLMIVVVLSFAGVDISHPEWLLYLSKRAGYLSIVWVPTILALVTKFNIVGKITGHSSQQLNFIHRLGGWLVFILASIHAIQRIIYLVQVHEFGEQAKSLFAIKGGIALWILLGWICVSSELRHRGYEFFLGQKLIISFVFLIFSFFFHLPKACTGYISFGLALVILDQLWRRCRIMYNSVPPPRALIEPLGEATKIVIENTNISWRAGQHAYISVPELSLLQSHPFTVSSRSRLEFVILAKHGFTKKLFNYAKSSTKCRVLIDGMYGHTPNFKQFGQVLLIAVSSGASYTVPILEDMLQSLSCVRRIHFVWVIKFSQSIAWYSEALRDATSSARKLGVDLKITIYATREREFEKQLEIVYPIEFTPTKPKHNFGRFMFRVNEMALLAEEDMESYIKCLNSGYMLPCRPQLSHKRFFESESFDLYLGRSKSLLSQSSNEKLETSRMASIFATTPNTETVIRNSGYHPLSSHSCGIPYEIGRPSIPDLIKSEVSQSFYGEIGICFCGNPTLARQVRNTVYTIQKQIFLHVEGFD